MKKLSFTNYELQLKRIQIEVVTYDDSVSDNEIKDIAERIQWRLISIELEDKKRDMEFIE